MLGGASGGAVGRQKKESRQGQPPGARAKAEGSKWHPTSHTKPHLGELRDQSHAEAHRTHPTSGQQVPPVCPFGRKGPAGHSQPDRMHGTGKQLGPPAPVPWWACTGGDAWEQPKPFSAMVLWELLGELGQSLARHYTRRTLMRGGCHLGLLGTAPPLLALRTGTRDEPLPQVRHLVISTALFLKVLMTVLTFAIAREDCFSAVTFCFSLNDFFGLIRRPENATGAQTHPHERTHLQPGLPFHTLPLPNPAPSITWAARLYSPVLRRGKSSRLS